MTDDERRFEQLAAAHGPRVLAYLARRTGTPHDAADVYQAVLIVAWRRLHDIPADEQTALAWLLGTARRCLANHRRSDARRLQATERLAETIRIQSAGSASDNDRETAVLDALKQCNTADRELLRLIYWDDLSTEQAARVLGIRPGGAARKRLARARDRLRGHLQAAGVDVPDGGRTTTATDAAPNDDPPDIEFAVAAVARLVQE